MPAADPSNDSLAQLRLGHLNMVQGVVARLSGFSASVKNFCVTIVVAIIGVAFQYQTPELLLAAAPAALLFASLDTYYLAQERRFRQFYDDIRSRPLSEAACLDLAPARLGFAKYVEALRSFSTGGFYALLLASVFVLLLFAYGRPDESAPRRASRADSAAGGEYPSAAASTAADPQRTGSDSNKRSLEGGERTGASGSAAGAGGHPERPTDTANSSDRKP